MNKLLIILALIAVSNCATTLPIKPDSRPVIIKAEKILKEYRKAPDNVEKSALVAIIKEQNEQLQSQIDYSDAAENVIKEEREYREDNSWKVSLVNWFIGAIVVLFLAVVAGLVLRFSGYKLPFVT